MTEKPESLDPGKRDPSEKEVRLNHEHDDLPEQQPGKESGPGSRIPDHQPSAAVEGAPAGAGATGEHQDPAAQPVIPGLEGVGGYDQALILQSASYSGPLLPEMVRQFDELNPGAGEKIIDAQLIAPQRRLDKLADAEIKAASTRRAGESSSRLG